MKKINVLLSLLLFSPVFGLQAMDSKGQVNMIGYYNSFPCEYNDDIFASCSDVESDSDELAEKILSPTPEKGSIDMAHLEEQPVDIGRMARVSSLFVATMQIFSGFVGIK